MFLVDNLSKWVNFYASRLSLTLMVMALFAVYLDNVSFFYLGVIVQFYIIDSQLVLLFFLTGKCSADRWILLFVGYTLTHKDFCDLFLPQNVSGTD